MSQLPLRFNLTFERPLQYALILFMLFHLSCTPSKSNPKGELGVGKAAQNLPVVVSSGEIKRIEKFKSQYVEDRNVDIWLPKNYDGKSKFSVLYMHDGQMLFDSTKTWNGQEWGVDEILTSLMDKQHIRNTIVVGIWNSKNRHQDYFPDVPKELLSKTLQDSLDSYLANQGQANFLDSLYSFDYVQFIVKELKPYIDQNFAVEPSMRSTFIAGSSMGGLISMYALCEFPETFGGAICMSTHWPGMMDDEDNPIPSYFLSYMQENLPEGGRHKFYFDYGTATLDSLYEPYQKQVDALMVKKGYPDKFWLTKKFEGDDHSERSWSQRLAYPMSFILGGP